MRCEPQTPLPPPPTPPPTIHHPTAPPPSQLEAASQFFVGAFWGSSTPTGELGDSESAQLERDQLRDWNRRYGSEGGGSGSEAALLVAKEGRRIVGCVSVSVGSYSRILDGRIGGGGGGGGGSFDPRSARTAAAAPSSSAKGSKGALPDLNRVRSEDVPLVANLAVAKRARKKGIGARLAREAERLAEGYGYPEIVLLVEESNAPGEPRACARQLTGRECLLYARPGGDQDGPFPR